MIAWYSRARSSLSKSTICLRLIFLSILMDSKERGIATGRNLVREQWSCAGLWLTEESLGAFEEALVQRGIVCAAEGREFLQLLALLVVQAARHFHEKPREEVAPLAAVNVDHPFTAQSEGLSALRPGRYLQTRFSFQGRDRHFAAKRGEGERDWYFAKQVVVLALEDGVLLDVNHDIEIALAAAANARFAIVRGAQPRAVGD